MAQETTKRPGYAVGVQNFEWMRQRGSLYADKTEYIWKMVTTDAVNFFLSRPRRFGKSLLVDTLQCYFEGRKGFSYSLYKYYMEDYVGSEDTLGSAYKHLRRKDITIEEFIDIVQQWYAGIPYSITDKNQNEQI